MAVVEPLKQSVKQPAGQKAPKKHGQKPQVLYTIGHTPESYIPTEPIRIETEKQKIDRAEDKTRDDESLEFFPQKTKEAFPSTQFETLITEDVSSDKGNGFNTKTTDKMAQPPVGIIGRYTLRHSPPTRKNAQRMIDYQQKDNQRPNDRNFVKKLLFHLAKVRKKSETAELSESTAP